MKSVLRIDRDKYNYILYEVGKVTAENSKNLGKEYRKNERFFPDMQKLNSYVRQFYEISKEDIKQIERIMNKESK